jgi:hypothetical protein
MSAKQNNNNQTISENNIRLLGRQYKIIDHNLQIVSSGLQKKNNIFMIMGLNLLLNQKYTVQVVCANRGLHD